MVTSEHWGRLGGGQTNLDFFIKLFVSSCIKKLSISKISLGPTPDPPINPVNMRHWPGVGPMLGRRRRQQANICPTTDQHGPMTPVYCEGITRAPFLGMNSSVRGSVLKGLRLISQNKYWVLLSKSKCSLTKCTALN